MKASVANGLYRIIPRIRNLLQCLLVFLLLLCVVETCLSLAVYLGYTGGSYLQHVTWHKDGTLSFSEFQREIAARSSGSLPQVAESGHGYKELPLCPSVPLDLGKPTVVDMKVPSFHHLEDEFSMLEDGGTYRPLNCRAHHKVALILPYRDRLVHLKIFLHNIHPFLQKQQLEYSLFVIELKVGIEFNRALLFNIGFLEASKRENYTCFIFHDVDLLPEDDRNLYRCTDEPRHMSVAVDKMGYKLPYNTIFGGVSALNKTQMEKVNGFSNLYFGWGGEDDDMYRRIRSRGMHVVRYTNDVARYKSMAHVKEKPNPQRHQLLHQGPRRFLSDGLNSLNYTVLAFDQKRLYTWILVEVDQKSIMKNGEKMMTRKRTEVKPLQNSSSLINSIVLTKKMPINKT